MDDIGRPLQLLDGFQDATRIESGTLGIVLVLLAILVGRNPAPHEEVVVVNEVYLHSCCRNACHLDDEGMVRVVNHNVHSAQPNDLMQLVATLVDGAPFGHEGAYLPTLLLYCLRQESAHLSHLCLGHKRQHLLCDEEYLLGFGHLVLGITIHAKIRLFSQLTMRISLFSHLLG